ncbi:MAG: carbohydrate-binding family 9-like protein [Polyangiaceae bacterium]|nr:carbohydrate-binding family 9-like protein [Polyangiaceae bacterium]
MKRPLLTVASLLVLASSLSLGATLVGCVGGSKGLSAEERERLKPYILDAVPSDVNKLDINFENRIRIVGSKFEPSIAKPGEEVKVTVYWRCDDKVDEGWILFTHMHDELSDHKDNLDFSGTLRERVGDQAKQILGPDRWEKGKIYVDSYTYRVANEVTGPDITVYTGVFKGNARLRILSGPNDGDNRAKVGVIKTGLDGKTRVVPTADVPSLQVKKLAAGTKIVVDGKADDAAWKEAVSTGPFVDVSSGKTNTTFPVNGQTKLLWDADNLYLFFEVKDPNVVGGFDKEKKKSDFTVTGQPKLWTKHTVEIMTDPDGDGDNANYYELQINPQNMVFHSQFDERQKPAPTTPDDGPFGHEDWNPKLKSSVVVNGTLDKADDVDQGYNVEVAIPWTAFSKAKASPPKPGDSWRMNFYAMMDNGGVAWSPILGRGNFHFAPRFGKITWLDEKGMGAAVTEVTSTAMDAGRADSGAKAAASAKPAPAASAKAIK